MQLASRVEKVRESVTMAFDAKSKAMKKKFPETIILAAGEPDFAPPEIVQQATIAAVKNGKTKYTAAKGELELRQAVAKWMAEKRDLKYEPDSQIIITNGGKEALYLALLAVVNPGDEVLIIKPYWTSYPEMVILCGGKVHYLDIHDLDKIGSVLDNTNIKAIILNSPNNPASYVLSNHQLAVLALELKERNIWVISDEIYSPIIFGLNQHFSIAQFDNFADKTILVDGASKAFAMTGYRLGYALGPANVIAAMAKFKSQTTGCPNSLAQPAAIAGLRDGSADVENMRQAYEQRLNNIILPFAQKIGLEYFDPQGAFYWFFKLPGEKTNCLQFCEELLVKEKLGLVPGVAFGYPGWVRLSFAASEKNLIEGLKRLKRFLNI
jgi:aspartate aminotransferase